jgi:hypothetical protein
MRVTYNRVKTVLEKICPRADGKKKCLSFSPPTPTRGHLERVGFGQKNFFLIFVI